MEFTAERYKADAGVSHSVFVNGCISQLVYLATGVFSNGCISQLVYLATGVFLNWCI